MNQFIHRIRQPVQRENAEQYLLITLLSFAASVTLTRLFLQLTGYPQLGGGEFHIAHVLWGGLFLFVASLLPLILSNRWVYSLGAILSGTGVGLFIDEVGKFITSNNNYFYPLAAPIIYAFFLLTVLLYLQVRRPRPLGVRGELYRIFEEIEEVLDHDLDPLERAHMEQQLKYIITDSDQPDLTRLAQNLLEFLSSDTLAIVPPPSRFWHPWSRRWQVFETRWINRLRMIAVLTGGLLALGIFELYRLTRYVPVGTSKTSLENILLHMALEGQIRGVGSLNWLAARLALEILVSMLLIMAGLLMIIGKDRRGVALGYLGLLLSLTTTDLLVFYFDQFSTILSAGVQFILLLLLIYYRRHFIPEKPSAAPPN